MIVTAIFDFIILVFTLVLYLQVVELKKNTMAMKIITCSFCSLLVAAYYLIAYLFKLISQGLAAFLCISLPSFIYFIIASKHKDARFITNFCFIDTSMLIVSFAARAVDHYFGLIALIVFCILNTLAFCFAIVKCRPFFKNYLHLLNRSKKGWTSASVCMIMIYACIIFSSQFPSPIYTRPEYYPVFIFGSAMIIAFFAFFVVNMVQKSYLAEVNDQLEAEREWHKKAYVDFLTGVKNRMAYVKKINDFERTLDDTKLYYAICIDINSFKKINDTMGHHKGDEILQHFASFLKKIFPKQNYRIYRIGGDEFAIIGFDVEEYDVKGRIAAINVSPEVTKMGYSVSAGYSKVIYGENSAFESAFIRADEQMYANKREMKLAAEQA